MAKVTIERLPGKYLNSFNEGNIYLNFDGNGPFLIELNLFPKVEKYFKKCDTENSVEASLDSTSDAIQKKKKKGGSDETDS